MKINKLTILLLLIIFSLVGFIIYDKVDVNDQKEINEEISLKEKISLPYVDVYLLSDKTCYLVPITEEEIDSLEGGKNLKERLTTLYEKANYFDIKINNYKLKGYKVKLDSNVRNIEKITIKENEYIVFLKENNTVGLFNYDEYFNLLNTIVIDNYNDLKDILEIKDKNIIYLDGSKKEFKLK